ncbi:MAG: DUF92 domain-containing protein [Gemmatimonadaceae bacterium]
MMERAIVGLALAGSIAVLAWRAGSLSRSGAAAATIVGTLAVAAGWPWGILLIWFFVSSSVLTRWRGLVKATRMRGVVEKGGPRDAVQVMANGAVFALTGAFGIWQGSTMWQTLGLGSLATAAADTFATEVGTALGATPRLILGGQRVAAGTSGAMSGIGTTASLVGAAAIGAVAWALGWSPLVALAVTIGGVVGAFADTLVGATIQERRRCPRCNLPTERRVHDCGSATIRVGGIGGFRNDLVNLTSGALGGLVAVAVVWGLR